MTRPRSSFLSHLWRRARAERRGSVILLAVGVLGIISIAALSYVTIVRLDRTSAEAAATRENYTKQVSEVVSHIQELITADLYGNKVVTDAVPQTPDPNTGFRALPEMFEDGDTRDIPVVYTPNFLIREQSNPSNTFPEGPVLDPLDENLPNPRRFAVGAPDDAWLSANDPRWDANVALTSVWPQISNLRDGYYWDEGDPNTPADDRWVRRDGRFVDLGQWFLKGVNNFANAGIDLLAWDNNNTTPDGRLGPIHAINQPVFGRAVNVMSAYTPPIDLATIDTGSINPLTPRDERQWVDTDGDLRPDARWTQLERLGRRFGLEWVVAARIIDLSAYVNVNSAMGATPNNGAVGDLQHLLGGGRTPAEIDIRRLLERSATTNWNQGISGSVSRSIDGSFVRLAIGDHLLNVGSDLVFQDMDGLTQATPTSPFYPYRPVQVNLPPRTMPELKWTQRDAWWIGAGANPNAPIVGGAFPLADTAMVDLYSFRSTNHPGIVSAVETAFDGPEGNPLLPSIDVSVDNYGPMRSRERPAEARRFQNGEREPVPTARQLRDSVRSYLTTISGASQVSPVPFLNRRDKRFYREQQRLKVNLSLSPMAIRSNDRFDESADATDVQRTFESLVWALAPLATDQPLSRELAEFGQGVGFDNTFVAAHYGGGTDGPAQYLNFAAPNAMAPVTLNNSGESANFAVMTAAMMAANIRDAVDPDDEPTLILLGNDLLLDGEPTDSVSRKIVDRNKTNGGTQETPGPVFELGLSLAHGMVSAVEPQSAGAAGQFLASTDVTGGDRDLMAIIAGMEREPFIVEATTIAVYSNEPLDGGAVSMPGFVTTSDAIGSAIIVQITNPWFGNIVIDQNWSIALARPGADLSLEADRVLFTVPGVGPMGDEPITIAPGESHTFYWLSDAAGASGWATNIHPEIIARIEALSADGATLLEEGVNRAGLVVPFFDFGVGSSVVLLRKIQHGNTETDTIDVVVDRLTAEASTDRPFPHSIENSPAAGLFGGGSFNLFEAPGAPDVPVFNGAYMSLLGYMPVQVPPDPRFLAGEPRPEFLRARIGLSSNVSRSGNRSSNGRGFPAYVVEVPGRNTVTVRRKGHAWMEPNAMFDSGVSTAQLIPEFIVTGDADSSLNLGATDPVLSIWQLDSTSKPFNTAWPGDQLPSFQLYVPDAQNGAPHLNALSELHNISCYSTTCLNWASRFKLDAWSTMSEKLGQSRFYNFQSQSGALNPYMGVLDPSRFILGNGTMAGSSDFPDALRIPLALRVFDCFETLPVTGPLVQGRVNINTAPEAVLRALPFMDVNNDIACAAGTLRAGDNRVAMLQRYRGPDPVPTQSVTDFRSNGAGAMTFLPGLRPGNPFARDYGLDEGALPPSVGLQSAGELAILDDWDPLTGSPIEDPPPLGGSDLTVGFLEAAAEPAGTIGFGFRRPLELIEEYGVTENDPTNDAEERLAVYRALSNIVTTRSDVFLAWFVIRGYDPQAIELIPTSGSADNRLKSMDDPRYNFGPVYESRWLAVFDRSNVKRPTDRARVVMLLEVPKATP